MIFMVKADTTKYVSIASILLHEGGCGSIKLVNNTHNS